MCIRDRLSSLIEPVTLVEKHRAHRNVNHDQYHTYNRPGVDLRARDQYTCNAWSSDAVLNAGARHFADTVRFGREFNSLPTPEMYIISSHACNPEAMLRAWPTSRLINITFTPQDLDQLAFNWITKNIIQDNRQQDLAELMTLLKSQWPPDRKPMPALDWNNTWHMTYLARWLNHSTTQRFQMVTERYPQALALKFDDIRTGCLVHQLDDIAHYCGVTLTDQRRANAELLIQEYSQAQVPVPWNLEEMI